MPAPLRPISQDGLYCMSMDPLQIQDPDTRFGVSSGVGDMNLPPYIREVDPSNQDGFPRNEGERRGS